MVAPLNVHMSLTLADAASGPMRAITGAFEGLQKVVNGLDARLNAVAASINNVGRASNASGLGTLTTQTAEDRTSVV